jgi:hypothetical protein
LSERRPQTEEQVIDLVRSIDVTAPPELHARVRRLSASGPPAQRRSRGRWRFEAAGALVAVAAVVVLVIVTSVGRSPAHTISLTEAAALALAPPDGAAPAHSASNPALLRVSSDGVAFPAWTGSGWHATGTRHGSIAGRAVTTVYYADAAGRRVGYAIVAGRSAEQLPGGVPVLYSSADYRLYVQGDQQVLTWHHEGRLCVVSGRGVGAAELLRLAGAAEHAS